MLHIWLSEIVVAIKWIPYLASAILHTAVHRSATPGNIVKQYLHKIENWYSQPPPHLEQSLGRVKCIVLMAGNSQNSFKTQFRMEIERYKTI